MSTRRSATVSGRLILALALIAAVLTTGIPNTRAPAAAATPRTAAAMSGPERFIHAAYQDFLGRAPTTTEITTTTAALNTGTTRGQILLGLAQSPEWVNHIVEDMYLDTLGRGSDAGGLAYWSGRIQRGELTVAQVAAAFYSSTEYFTTIGGGTTRTWISDLYTKLLHRDPDTNGLTYWIDQTSTAGRYTVAHAFYQSLESRQTRVAGLYEALLGRAPDPGGLAYWAEQVLTLGDIALAVNLAGSSEYYATALLPAAPVLDTVEGDGASVMVTWEPNDPVEQVTSYRVTATPDTGSSTPECPAPTSRSTTVEASFTLVWVRGVCTGVVYRVSMTATNPAGTSPASAASGPAVPWTTQPPRPPLLDGLLSRDTRLEIAWSPPAFDGGSQVTGYTLTVKDPAGQVVATQQPGADAVTATITGLTNDTEYTLDLAAVNAAGTSPTTTITGTPTLARAPAPPGQGTAHPNGANAIAVDWTAPGDDGGSPITSYQVAWQQVTTGANGALTPVTGAPVHTTTVTGATSTTLTDFEQTRAVYRITITAVNAAGPGDPLVLDDPVTPLVEVKPGVIILTTPTAAAAEVTGNRLDWPAPAPTQTSTLTTGSIVVAPATTGTPNGLLVEITGITRDRLGVHTTTRTATLDQVFTTMTLSTTLSPTADASPGQNTFTPAGPGVAPQTERFGLQNDFTLALTFAVEAKAKVKGTTTSGVSVSGQVSVSNTTSVGIDVRTNWAAIPNGIRVDASNVTQASVAAKAEIYGTWERKLGEVSLPPATIMAGPVPIVLQPKAVVLATAEGHIIMTISAAAQLGGGLTWDSGTPGDLTPTNLSTPPTVTGSPSGGPNLTLTGSIGLKIQGILALYTAAGPSASAGITYKATFNPTAGPNDDWFRVERETSLSVGLALDLFAFHTDIELTLATISSLAYSLTPPGTPGNPTGGTTARPFYSITAPDTIPTGTPTPLTATRSDGATPPPTWTIHGGTPGDTITNTGTLTATDPPGRTLTITITDTQGATGTLTVTLTPNPHPPLTGTTTRITNGNNGSYEPAISADGRYITYNSDASNLVPNDTNEEWDVFVWDNNTGTTTRITNGNNTSGYPAISADGRYITYTSAASNLVPNDTNEQDDVFVWDKNTGTTTRITNGNNSRWAPAISADGRYITYHSDANLVPNDTNGHRDVFVWDNNTGTTTRITPGTNRSWAAAISADGHYITYTSSASNLVPSDTNEQPDVFVWQRTG
ncbi:MAG: DUF4214 domain-containing protein [Actinomycetales bacterium]